MAPDNRSLPRRVITQVKRFVLFLFSALAIVALTSVVALAQGSAPNLTGTWVVEQSGLNGTSTSKITVSQSGTGLTGQNAANGNSFTGQFVSDSQINGTWHGPGGAGWLTIYATPNGHSFNGTWGYNGRKANGSFVGNKVLPPSPITAAGTWNVTGAGTQASGGAAFAGQMACTQSGPSVVCKAGGVTLNGKFRTKNKVRATWHGPKGAGWFSFWFNDDNNSFNGTWGYGDVSNPASGRVVGQRAL